ncbi:MAG: Uma2 family endonuclease [Burkholderiales bacterium]
MLAEVTLSPADLARRWAMLQAQGDTPDYCELNEFGELIMSPRPTNDHQRVVQAVAFAIREQLGPEVVAEVSVLTDRGVRVPDIAWMPPEKWKNLKGQTPLQIVPDLCLEVLSAGNTREEINMKVGAYLRGGAKEVITVGLNGRIELHGPEGIRDRSVFGLKLELADDLF